VRPAFRTTGSSITRDASCSSTRSVPLDTSRKRSQPVLAPFDAVELRTAVLFGDEPDEE
jgi:hypothetical protein